MTPTKIIDAQPEPAGTFQAIWDTAASVSSITRKVIDQIGLEPIGIDGAHNPHGVAQRLPGSRVFAEPGLFSKPVRDPRRYLGFDMLIGMDIITTDDFAITNLDGETVCSFRYRCRSCGPVNSSARKLSRTGLPDYRDGLDYYEPLRKGVDGQRPFVTLNCFLVAPDALQEHTYIKKCQR